MKHNNENDTRYSNRMLLMAFVVVASVGFVTTFLASCARMGQPDGGWFDEVPPRVVGASPAERSTDVTSRRIDIRFSEYIKVDNATENVVICPPQIEQPEIKTVGKSIRIDLKDSLKPNTTYTVDFSDAISDNNEGNAMGNYTYVFSTGKNIDTLEVSGYVLNAEDLEPVKGSLVGLYDNLSDTAFTTLPMLRIGRTDGSGHFRIRGIAPGKYRVFSLIDSDGDFRLSQRGEQLGFSADIITPTSKPDTYQDTTWVDSLHIADIKQMPYTHFLPDDICLLSFVQMQTERYLIKTERNLPERMMVYFSTPSDTLPLFRALNYDDKDAYVIETSAKKDTITYWLRDTTLVNQDTLRVEMTYTMTDTLGALVSQTDTIEFLPKIAYEKRLKKRMDDIEKWEKSAEKARKKGREPAPHPDLKFLSPKVAVPDKMSPDKNIMLTFETPLESIDTTAIHLYSKIDTLWYRSPVEISDSGLPPRTYVIRGEWRPGTEYSLEIDSAAFRNIYGHVSKEIKQGVKIGEDKSYASLFVEMKGIRNDTADVIVEMLDKNGNCAYRTVALRDTAEFYYISPGEYFLRAVVDANRNGVWDTGEYSEQRQAEEVYYMPDAVECKANWDHTAVFDVSRTPRYLQKPRALVKQKEEKKQKRKDQNAERAKKLKIPYDREAVNKLF